MAFFPDLTPYTYHRLSMRDNTWNVGWLSCDQPFTRGDVSPAFTDALWTLCKYWVVMMRGFHTCDLCPHLVEGRDLLRAVRGDDSLELGYAQIRAFGSNGRTYAAPNLIYHYVTEHGYLPPEEFVVAVLDGLVPGSADYMLKLEEIDLECHAIHDPPT